METYLETTQEMPESELPQDSMPLHQTIGGIAYVRDAYGCYMPESFLNAKTKIRHPSDALPVLSSIRLSPQEIFAVQDLDGNNQVIQVRQVTVGLYRGVTPSLRSRR